MRTLRKEIPMKLIKPSLTDRIVVWFRTAYYANKNAFTK